MISRNHQKTHANIDEILHIDPSCPASPIFALLTQHPRSLAQHCQDSGFVVRAVVPPTVPTRRVRVCLHAGNSFQEVDRLVQKIDEWLKGRLWIDAAANEGEVIKARL
jgi:8-amino-7-oxononanoate synthase